MGSRKLYKDKFNNVQQLYRNKRRRPLTATRSVGTNNKTFIGNIAAEHFEIYKWCL